MWWKMSCANERSPMFAKPALRLTVAGLCLSLALVVVYYATWGLYFEPMYYTEHFLPYFLGVLALLPVILWAFNSFLFKKRALAVLVICASAAGIVGHIVMLAYVLSKLIFLLTAGVPYFIAAAFVAVVLLFAFSHKFGKRTRRAVVVVMCGVFLTVTLVGLFDLKPLYFNSGAVVFAVGEEYQICWSTSTASVGYVEVDGVRYYDDTAGTLNTANIHKATVPRAALDEAGGYKVVSRKIILPHTYLTVGAGSIAKGYPFRAPDVSDGLQVYNISDNHLLNAGASAAGKYWGERLDVLIANGDHVNDLENELEITMMYDLLSEVTGSARPVVVTRGNHETAGPLEDFFPKCIGSRDGKFYYTVELGGVDFLVLDYAATETDDNPVASAVANYDNYRAEEMEWLETTVDAYLAEETGAKWLIVACHVPYGIRAQRYYPEFSRAVIAETERMGADLLIGGHVHSVGFYEGNEGINEAAYPVIAGSIRNDKYLDHQSISATRFTGTALDIREDGITVLFTDQDGRIRGEYEIKR